MNSLPPEAQAELVAAELALVEKFGVVAGALMSAMTAAEFLVSGLFSPEEAQNKLFSTIERIFSGIVPKLHPGKQKEVEEAMDALLVLLFQKRFPEAKVLLEPNEETRPPDVPLH